MRIVATGLSVLMMTAFLGACGAEDDGATGEASESFRFGKWRWHKKRCGNHRINPGEQCDGRQLGRETCASVTMGARPEGKLKCSRRCTFDTSHCRGDGTGGTAGTGGAAGSGGVAGSGGLAGTGGVGG